jgi:MFS family permease
VVFGIGAAAVFTATTVALLHSATGPRRDRVMGWRGTATSLGGVVWPLIGGAAAGLAWQAPFAIYLLGVPLGIATWILVPQRRAGDRGPAEPEPSGGAGLLRLLRRRPVVLAHCALLALGTALMYVLLVFVPLRLAEIGVRAPLAVAALAGLMSIAMSVSGLVFARLSARFGAAGLLPAAYVTVAVAFAALAAGEHPVTLAVGTTLFGAAAGLTVPALTVLLGRSTPPVLHGRVMALSGTAIFLGQFLAPLLVGPIVDGTSTRIGFAVAAAVAGLTAALLLVDRRLVNRRRPGTR